LLFSLLSVYNKNDGPFNIQGDVRMKKYLLLMGLAVIGISFNVPSLANSHVCDPITIHYKAPTTSSLMRVASAGEVVIPKAASGWQLSNIEIPAGYHRVNAVPPGASIVRARAVVIQGGWTQSSSGGEVSMSGNGQCHYQATLPNNLELTFIISTQKMGPYASISSDWHVYCQNGDSKFSCSKLNNCPFNTDYCLFDGCKDAGC